MVGRLRRAAIPPGFEADMVACVLCDQRFKDLCEACGTARPAGQRNNQARGGGGQARGRGRGPAGQNPPAHETYIHTLCLQSLFMCWRVEIVMAQDVEVWSWAIHGERSIC